MPVSVSTSTSAICTPPTPLFERSGGLLLSGFFPRTVSGIAPNFEQACFQLSERLGSPFTRTVPSTHSKSPGWALSAGATLANSASRASTASRRRCPRRAVRESCARAQRPPRRFGVRRGNCARERRSQPLAQLEAGLLEIGRDAADGARKKSRQKQAAGSLE